MDHDVVAAVKNRNVRLVSSAALQTRGNPYQNALPTLVSPVSDSPAHSHWSVRNSPSRTVTEPSQTILPVGLPWKKEFTITKHHSLKLSSKPLGHEVPADGPAIRFPPLPPFTDSSGNGVGLTAHIGASPGDLSVLRCILTGRPGREKKASGIQVSEQRSP